MNTPFLLQLRRGKNTLRRAALASQSLPPQQQIKSDPFLLQLRRGKNTLRRAALASQSLPPQRQIK
jgi:hypothetical protein